MDKRELLFNLVQNEGPAPYVPAAFFMHFDSRYQRGQAAIDRHLEFFRYTGMDFVKIQYEQGFPPAPPILTPRDWPQVPLVPEDHFETTLEVVRGLVKAAGREAPVLMTIYSPFMWATHLGGQADIVTHLMADPEPVRKGLAVLTENVRKLVRGCKKAGVDGFYVSTQGGEAFRFGSSELFRKYVKPTDLAVWDAIGDCPFNILHICDYEGGYADLTPFLDYPGQVVNCSLKLGQLTLPTRTLAQMFGRPIMGGLERQGVLATGDPQAVRQAAEELLADAPERFILAADCTVPGETPWENLQAAVEAAHQVREKR